MLPKNRLRAKRLERLHIFPDGEHPYEANLLKDHAADFGATWRAAKQAASAPRSDAMASQVKL